MSDFDTLLDFGDSGTTDTTKQSAQDPFAAPDSTANGGGGENLLDLGFDVQVPSQNGGGKISLEANTNPLYEFQNSSGDIMASEPSNELFDISGETHTQELKPASTNPLYDFLENEKVNENQTNGHTEDLLGMTDTNEVDLLGNSGPITSDDSGVTMDANNLDVTNGDVILEQQNEEQHNVEKQNVEQQNGESSEESDIQGKTNMDTADSTGKEVVNGTDETANKDQLNEGPLNEEIKPDQGTMDQEPEADQVNVEEGMSKIEQELPVTEGKVDDVQDDVIDKKEKEESNDTQIPLTDDKEIIEQHDKEESNDTQTPFTDDKEIVEEKEKEESNDTQIPLNDDKEVIEESVKEESKDIQIPLTDDKEIVEESGKEESNDTQIPLTDDKEIVEEKQTLDEDITIENSQQVEKIEIQDSEYAQGDREDENLVEENEQQESLTIENSIEPVNEQEADSTVNEEKSVEQTELISTDKEVHEEKAPATDGLDQVDHEKGIEDQEHKTVLSDVEIVSEQSNEEQIQIIEQIDSHVSSQTEDEISHSVEQAIAVDDVTEQQIAMTQTQEEKLADQQHIEEPETVLQKTEIESVPVKQQESLEPDEDSSQTIQTQKQTADSSNDPHNEGALKVNGTSEENHVGGTEEDAVRDPNIFRETREKEEVHFAELNNVRQRFESGGGSEEETTHRQFSVKDDYDEGGEYESTPAVNPDVVKETDNIGEELPEVGMAKNILAKFKQLEVESDVPRPSERRVTPPRQSKVEYESTPKERLEQYEGKSDAGIFESQPSVNEGMVKHDDQLEEEPVLEKGHAKNIVSRYKEIEEERAKATPREKKELTPDRSGKVEYISEPRGQSIQNYEVQAESGVFESTPKLEEDVIRADEKPDEILPEEGMAKNLLSKFKQLESEVVDRPPPSPLRRSTPDRSAKREFVSGPPRGYLEKYEGKSESGTFESEPVEPKEVVKSDEVREEVMPEAGMAKKQMERFKEMEKESASPVSSSRKEFTPPRETSPGRTVAGVLENTPTERHEGVVKSTDVYDTELPEQGMAKNIASRFKQMESESSSSVSPVRSKKEFTPPPEAGVYESTPSPSLVVEQRKAEAGVLESTPTKNLDLAREHDPSPEAELPERGYAKNLVSKFKQLESESAKGSSSPSPKKYKEFTPPRDTRGLLSPKSPAGVTEGVQPSELPGQYQQQSKAGVYENEPEARPDLLRESDTDWNEGLPAANTALLMKKRFQEMENKALKELETPEPVHRKETTGKRKKEDSPSPDSELSEQPASGITKMEVENQNQFSEESDENQNQLKQKDEIEEKLDEVEVLDAGIDDEDGEIVIEQRGEIPEAEQEGDLGVGTGDIGEAESVTDLDSDKRIEPDTVSDDDHEESTESQSDKEVDLQKDSGDVEEVSEETDGVDKDVDVNKETDLDGDDNGETGNKENIPAIQPDPVSDDITIELKEESVKDENDNDNRASPVDMNQSDDLKIQGNGKTAVTKPKPAVNSIKNSIAKFESPAKKDKGMFVAIQPDKCSACGKTVYAMEKLEMNKNIYHRGCFKCSHCSATLTAKTFSINEGVIFCTTHFKQLFARKGNYDEGFGRQLYKKKWQEEQQQKQDASA